MLSNFKFFLCENTVHEKRRNRPGENVCKLYIIVFVHRIYRETLKFNNKKQPNF